MEEINNESKSLNSSKRSFDFLVREIKLVLHARTYINVSL